MDKSARFPLVFPKQYFFRTFMDMVRQVHVKHEHIARRPSGRRKGGQIGRKLMPTTES